MEIPKNPITPLLDQVKLDVKIDKLQTGQTLHAKVVEILPSKTDVILRIGNQLLSVKSDIPVNVGQTLKVLVEKTTSELILKVTPPVQQAKIINANLRQLLPKQTAVNEFQQPLRQILEYINQQSTKITAPLQEAVLTSKLAEIKQITTNIIQALPNQKKIITVEGLKNAIQNSGVFLEPKLQKFLVENRAILTTLVNTTKAVYITKAQAQQPIKDPTQLNIPSKNNNPIEPTRIDLKANLIKLIQVLKSWPTSTSQPVTSTSQQTTPTPQQALTNIQVPQLKTVIQAQQQQAASATSSQAAILNFDQKIKELLTKTEGALSKITVNQLASSNTEGSPARQAWQIEIPLFNSQSPESIFLKIEREDSNNKESKETELQWTVSLEMEPPNLGLIRNKLSLKNEHINSSFWAENNQTRVLIKQHLDILRAQFHRANLKPESIQVQTGLGPTIQTLTTSSSILSEKA